MSWALRAGSRDEEISASKYSEPKATIKHRFGKDRFRAKQDPRTVMAACDSKNTREPPDRQPNCACSDLSDKSQSKELPFIGRKGILTLA